MDNNEEVPKKDHYKTSAEMSFYFDYNVVKNNYKYNFLINDLLNGMTKNYYIKGKGNYKITRNDDTNGCKHFNFYPHSLNRLETMRIIDTICEQSIKGVSTT